MSYCHNILKQFYVTTSPYISLLLALVFNVYAIVSTDIDGNTHDTNKWLITSFSCCLLTMCFTVATRFGSTETWIKFVSRNSIIPYTITKKILFHLLRQHTPHLQVLGSLSGPMGSGIDRESIRISELNSINRVFDASHFTNQRYKSFMIHGIHSFLQSVLITFIIRDQPDSGGISTVVWSWILTAYIIDFALTSLFYVALVFPQFHLQSFIFLWLCFMTDYMRILTIPAFCQYLYWLLENYSSRHHVSIMVIGVAPHDYDIYDDDYYIYDDYYYIHDDSIRLFRYIALVWGCGRIAVFAFISFVVICLSFTHAMGFLSRSSRTCTVPKFILWWLCLASVYCIFWFILADLLAISWIGIIFYHNITQHFEKYDNVTVSNILNASISYINKARDKHDEIYRLFAINKTQIDGSAETRLLNEWVDEMIQTQCKTIRYKDMRLHFPNKSTTQPSKALFQYKSLFYILTKHYPIDFDGGFGCIRSSLNTFFVGTILIVLLPCYILSRVVSIVYPFLLFYVATKTGMNSTLLIIVCCLMVVVLYLMIRIVLLYDKLWHIGGGCKMSETDIYNMRVENILEHWRSMKSYAFARQRLFEIFDKDIGTIILTYLNDSFTSHLDCPQQ
eukprot:575510_1